MRGVHTVRNGALLFVVLIPLTLSALQWHLWSETAFTSMLLTLPLDPAVPLPAWLSSLRPLFAHAGGYFAFYVLGRFWLHAALTLLSATSFFLVLRVFSLVRAGSVPREDISVAFVMSLLVGWPGFVIFLILFFLVAIAYALLCAAWGHRDVSITMPLLLSAAVTLVLGEWLVSILHLGVLVV